MTDDIQLQDPALWAKGLKQDYIQTVLVLVGDFRTRGEAVVDLLQELLEPIDPGQECRRAVEKLMKLYHAPSDKATHVNPALPVITDRLRREFPIHKHMRWAIDITDADLHALLAVIGTFARDSDPLFDLLVRNASRSPCRYAFFRAFFALKSLIAIVRGERYKSSQYGGHMLANQFRLQEWIRSKDVTDDFALVLGR